MSNLKEGEYVGHEVYFPEQDRVQIVIDAVTVTFEILLVQNRQNGVGDHHKECLLRTVR